MLDQLRAMAVFAKAVEAGSFRGAAKALGLSPSVVSHHVSQLEAVVGAALLYRSTRKLTLTADGQKLYESARDMVAAAENGLSDMAATSASPTGHLKITAPAALAAGSLMDHLAEFALAFPQVALTMHFSDAPIDLIQNGIDVAIRAGTLKDSSLKSKLLFELPRTLVTTKGYATKKPAPKRPDDLATWEWIRLHSRPPRAVFVDRCGERVEVALSSRLVLDSAEGMLGLVRHGLGLAILPSAMVDLDLRAGRLVEPLPEWRPETPRVYAVWPANATRASLTSRLVSFIERRMSRQDR